MDDSISSRQQDHILPSEVHAALLLWYGRVYTPNDILICHTEHGNLHKSEDNNIYVVNIKTKEHPYGCILRIFADRTNKEYSFQQLYERGERPYFDVEEEIKELTAWCQRYFNEQHVDIREMAELPVPYPNKYVGYRNIVVIPNHPHGIFVDMIVDEEGNIIDFQYIPEWDYTPNW